MASALSVAGDAGAVGWMGTEASFPTEERVLVAVSSQRTTLYSQLRFQSAGGRVAIIVPVEDGAALDWSSRAFFEALEDATAPRIVAPSSVSGKCPGSDEPAAHIFGDIEGSETLEPIEVAILDEGQNVLDWAEQRALVVSPGLRTTLLAAAPATRFFVAQFEATEGESLTKVLRIVQPRIDPEATTQLPFSYLESGDVPVRLVTWTVGEQRALVSGVPVLLDLSKLELDAGNETSNYFELLSEAFSGQTTPVLFDMSSHEALRDNVSIGGSGLVAPGLTYGYFGRAAAYGETIETPSSCVSQSAVILNQSARIGVACPPSTLGVVGGGAACTADAFEPGEVDPALLRCGPLTDDLAIVLSDLEPKDAWLTRATVLVPPVTVADVRDISFPGGERLDPEVQADSVDFSNCSGEGGGGDGGSGDGGNSSAGPTSTGSGTTVQVPVYGPSGCSSCGSVAIIDYVEEDESTAPDSYYSEDDCDSDTTSYDTSYEGCDCSDTSGTYDEYSGDDCSCGETSGTADYGGDDCDCSGGDEFGDGCDSGGSDGCDSPSGEGCDFDCALPNQGRHNAKRHIPRRLNGYAYGLLVLLVPTRRALRQRAQKKRPIIW